MPDTSLDGSPRGVPLYKNGKLARFKKNRQPLRLFEIARVRVRLDHINRTAMITHACVCVRELVDADPKNHLRRLVDLLWVCLRIDYTTTDQFTFGCFFLLHII